MHHPTDRIAHTTAFVTPVVEHWLEREIGTVKYSYALSRIEEIFDCLVGNNMFSVLDTKIGYHQVETEEKHRPRTAFTVGPLGFYEYNRINV